MPDILIPPAYSRENGNFPEFRMENMIWEETPTNEKGVAILSRPPLVEERTVGTGPIRGTFQRDDVFDGDEFIISGVTLYRMVAGVPTVVVTPLLGTGPVRWAATAREIVVTLGVTAYSYNGTNTAGVVMPDDQEVVSVAVLNTVFVYVTRTYPNTIPPGRYYFSAPNDGRSVNALDFINAESSPDRLVDVVAFGDNLYLAGSSSIEVAMTTANADAPFQRINQRVYDIGVDDVGLMTLIDNGIYVLASDNIVYRLGQVPERVSNHGLEEKIKASATKLLFSFKWQGHNFLVIRLDSGAWLLDMATKQPTKFTTYGRGTWAPLCTHEIGEEARFGDDTTGKIWMFGDYDELDCGQPFKRVFTAAFPLSDSGQSVYNVLVDHNPGATMITSGQGADPLLDMRYSRDAAQTWSANRSTRLGTQGQTRRQARYGACGMFDSPGAVFEFSMTDPGPLRVSRVRVNDSMSGRSR